MIIKTIYKYQILPPGANISISAGAKVVAVHEQDGSVFIWAEIESDNGVCITRQLVPYAIGQFIKGGQEYWGTAFMQNGVIFYAYEKVM